MKLKKIRFNSFSSRKTGSKSTKKKSFFSRLFSGSKVTYALRLLSFVLFCFSIIYVVTQKVTGRGTSKFWYGALAMLSFFGLFSPETYFSFISSVLVFLKVALIVLNRATSFVLNLLSRKVDEGSLFKFNKKK